MAPTREHVQAFWRAGLSVGATDDGEPGERSQYTPGYYGAFLRDPDGNSAEAVIHDDTRRGGNIDHLWLGVRDLEAASAFYACLARHTGLREGRRWENGRQFRGAWATFSLVADGRPATEISRSPSRRRIRTPSRTSMPPRSRAATAVTVSRESALRYGPGCYAASVLDPDGTNVESVSIGCAGGRGLRPIPPYRGETDE